MRGRRYLLTALLAGGASAGTSPLAAAAGSAPFPLTGTASEGYARGANRLAVEVRAPPGARCSLRVAAPGSSRTFRAVRVDRADLVAWHWPSTGVAPRSTWTFAVRCTLGSSFAWRTRLVEPGIPSPAGALVGGGSASAASCDAQGVCLAGDRFEVGQCTWYAAGRRPDLIGIVEGNAGGWLLAAAGRVPEGATPVVGALAVWRPGRAGAGALGHVAYVAQVAGGRVLVDDSNWQPTPTSAPLQVHEHWIAAKAPSGYIYGGPAGTGPPR